MKRRPLAVLLAAIVPLAGCGGRTATPPKARATPALAATVNGSSISWADVRRYAAYSIRFFHWAGRPAAAVSADSCASGNASGVCRQLDYQVLKRLIEERLVSQFAARHHLTLSAADTSMIDDELIRLEGDRSTAQSFFAGVGENRGFVRSMLQRQLIVQRVERYIAPAWTREGLAVRVRKITFRSGTVPRERAEAKRLLAGVKVLPPDARVSAAWIARVRTPLEWWGQLIRARLGQYVGPFAKHDAVVLYQVLARGTHRFGRPARETLETRFFNGWLVAQLAKAALHCFNSRGRTVPCPV